MRLERLERIESHERPPSLIVFFKPAVRHFFLFLAVLKLPPLLVVETLINRHPGCILAAWVHPRPGFAVIRQSISLKQTDLRLRPQTTD